MKAHLLLAVIGIFTFNVKAEFINGIIKKQVETTRQGRVITSYYIDDEKVQVHLPSIINYEYAESILGAEVSAEGDLRYDWCGTGPGIHGASLVNLVSFSIHRMGYFPAIYLNFRGVVKKFEGMMVETPRPYLYFALETDEQRPGRWLLPKVFNAKVISILMSKSEDSIVEFSAHREILFCTDMSRACASGVIKGFNSFSLQL